MTGVLVWKVVREQQLVWLAMAALAIGLLLLQVLLLDPGTPREMLIVAYCLIAYIYGLVVGSILLAGEREGGTATFLEVLPATRLAIWGVKCSTGLALVLAQVLYLCLLASAGGFLRDFREGSLALGVMLVLATLGFAWGLFFSGRTQTAMAAVLYALLGQVVTFPLLLGIWAAMHWLVPDLVVRFGEALFALSLGVLLVEGLLLASGVGQARRDRLRRLDPAQAQTGARQLQWAALTWLAWRQVDRLFRWLAVGALAAGLLLPLGVMLWPLLTLVLGVIAGVAVFAGDQMEGAGRFLGEQRLPPGRVWLVKVGLHLTLAIGVALLLLIPAVSRVMLLSFQAGASQGRPLTEFDRLRPFLQWGPYLTLWLSHGFSIGCLCGLLFRKPVVAGVIALGLSLLLVSLWAPSLLVGGLHGWQIWGMPVVLVLLVRLLVWPWATGQLTSSPALTRIGVCLSLAGLWFAAALTYRVYEVPLVPDRLNLPEFEQRVEEARKNEVGLRLRMLLKQVGKQSEEPGNHTIQAAGVVQGGWRSAQEKELSDWLDRTFEQPWVDELAAAARRPRGVVEDMQTLTYYSSLEDMQPIWRGADLLAARGLQLQARGDPAAFVEHLETGLALVRQARYLEPSPVFWFTRSAQSSLLQGVEHWLARLDGRPDLLRRVVMVLVKHGKAEVEDLNDLPRADYLVAQNMVNQPELWVGRALDARSGSSGSLAALVAAAWRTPWEQARLLRLIRYLANRGSQEFSPPDLLCKAVLTNRTEVAYQWEAKVQLPASELMVALRLFEAETGRPATTLEELTPRILASLPTMSGISDRFMYRLSSGEVLAADPWGRFQTRKVAAGQGVLTIGYLTYIVPLPAGK